MPYHRLRDPERLQALIDALVAVGADLDLDATLQRTVEQAAVLSGARYAALVVLDSAGRRAVRVVPYGMDPAAVAAIGRLPEGRGVLGEVLAGEQPVRIDDLGRHPSAVGFPAGHPPMRTFLGVPVVGRGGSVGDLYLADRAGGEPFGPDDEALVVGFAAAAAIAMENARLHRHVQELTLAAERRRIGDGLHDTVVQRVFGAGLSLQAAAERVSDGEVRNRIDDVVAELDGVIRLVRTTVFALAAPSEPPPGLPDRVLQVCSEAGAEHGVDPDVHFRGSMDVDMPVQVIDEMLTTLRQAIAWLAGGAAADPMWVAVAVDGASLVLDVTRDRRAAGAGGSGPRQPAGPVAMPQGLDQVRERAGRLGGTLHAGVDDLHWQVPIGAGGASPAFTRP